MKTFQFITRAAVVVLLAVIAFVLSATEPRRVEAAYEPPGTYTYTTGTSVAQAGVLAHSGAAVLGGALAWNASGGTAYFQCFDRITQPSTGTAPVWGSASCGTSSFCSMATVPQAGIRFAAGVYCGFSSTGPTYTQAAGASTGFYSIAFR